jgi:hypothetical protein
MTPPRYVIIANPGSKRWEAYAPELRAFWQERGAEAEIDLVPWRNVLDRHGNLDGLPAFERPALVRLESPGRDWEVSKRFFHIGSQTTGKGVETDWLSLPYRKGYLVQPELLYQGFRRVLQGLRASFDSKPQLRPLCCPLTVAELFDKNATQARLNEASLPTPRALSAPDSAAQLLEQLREAGFRTTYVKLNTGSSASGIVVVHRAGPSVWGISSLIRLRDGFASTRRLQRYEGSDLEAVLAFLLGEGACVQEGISMAQIDGQNFDVRVVMIHGQPRFTIFRLSTAPMTNLHLGGRRGEPLRCRREIPPRAWLDALDHCSEVARLYPAEVLGVDLLFERGSFRPFLLEVNAFGDFFPGLVDATGRSVHWASIEATAMQFGLAGPVSRAGRGGG